MPGEFFFADKAFNHPDADRNVRRGDIVVFVNPNNRTQIFVKRVIALPGGRVELSGSIVRLNGRTITRPRRHDSSWVGPKDGLVAQEHNHEHVYTVLLDTTAKAKTTSPTVFTVPNGQAFVLGDNRGRSTDSRKFGTVPLADIVGRAEQIWYSKAPQGSLRWGRLGTVLSRS